MRNDKSLMQQMNFVEQWDELHSVGHITLAWFYIELFPFVQLAEYENKGLLTPEEQQFTQDKLQRLEQENKVMICFRELKTVCRFCFHIS